MADVGFIGYAKLPSGQYTKVYDSLGHFTQAQSLAANGAVKSYPNRSPMLSKSSPRACIMRMKEGSNVVLKVGSGGGTGVLKVGESAGILSTGSVVKVVSADSLVGSVIGYSNGVPIIMGATLPANQAEVNFTSETPIKFDGPSTLSTGESAEIMIIPILIAAVVIVVAIAWAGSVISGNMAQQAQWEAVREQEIMQTHAIDAAAQSSQIEAQNINPETGYGWIKYYSGEIVTIDATGAHVSVPASVDWNQMVNKALDQTPVAEQPMEWLQDVVKWGIVGGVVIAILYVGVKALTSNKSKTKTGATP